MTGHQKYTNELTKREQEVLDCLMDALNYKETAKKLGISYSTVKSFVDFIFQKKEVNSLPELLVKEYKKKVNEVTNEQKENNRI